MRLEVSLISLRESKISLNYNHLLAGLIYRVVGLKSPTFSRRLHSEGFMFNGRRFKMFTFSKLFYFDGAYVDGDLIIIPEDSEISFLISSPYERFMCNFAFGLTRVKRIRLGDGNIFRLRSVEVVFEPDIFLGDVMEEIDVGGVFISPLVISKVSSRGHRVYLNYDDAELELRIYRNLLMKYRAYYGKEIGDNFNFKFDFDYISSRGGRVTKLISIKEGTGEETKVKGLVIPFRVFGTRRLIKFAWDVGLGEKNSMGFGMWDVWRKIKNGG
jgi:CRISPR-associated endoribonuclease Cas6